MKRINTKKISLILSGGGARGAFHLGVLQGLEDANIEIMSISGASIGSIVGATYLAGNSPKEMLDFFISNEFRKNMKFRPFSGAFFQLNLNTPTIEKLLYGYQNIEDLPKPLHVSITNIDKGVVVYKNSGDIRKVISASCAMLPMVGAVKIDNELYADGGILDNFPISPLKDLPYPTVGVNLHPNAPLKRHGLLPNLGRAMFLCWYSGVSPKTEKCDFYIAPHDLTNYSILKTDKSKELFELGLKSVKKILP